MARVDPREKFRREFRRIAEQYIMESLEERGVAIDKLERFAVVLTDLRFKRPRATSAVTKELELLVKTILDNLRQTEEKEV